MVAGPTYLIKAYCSHRAAFQVCSPPTSLPNNYSSFPSHPVQSPYLRSCRIANLSRPLTLARRSSGSRTQPYKSKERKAVTAQAFSLSYTLPHLAVPRCWSDHCTTSDAIVAPNDAHIQPHQPCPKQTRYQLSPTLLNQLVCDLCVPSHHHSAKLRLD